LDAGHLVGHLVPGDTVHGFLAEHSVRLFPDEMFADLLGSSLDLLTARTPLLLSVISTQVV
jgi:hypothetical protein